MVQVDSNRSSGYKQLLCYHVYRSARDMERNKFLQNEAVYCIRIRGIRCLSSYRHSLPTGAHQSCPSKPPTAVLSACLIFLQCRSIANPIPNGLPYQSRDICIYTYISNWIPFTARISRQKSTVQLAR